MEGRGEGGWGDVTEAGILKLSLEAISGSASVAAVSDGSDGLLSDLLLRLQGLLPDLISNLLSDSQALRLALSLAFRCMLAD